MNKYNVSENILTHKTFGEVRYLYMDNEIYYRANDLCKILGYKTVRGATDKYCLATGIKQCKSIDSAGRPNKFVFVSRQNVRELINHSDKSNDYKSAVRAWLFSYDVVQGINHLENHSADKLDNINNADTISESSISENPAPECVIETEKSVVLDEPKTDEINTDCIINDTENIPSVEITTFSNSDFGDVRTLEINGEAWFVGKDITEILGYANASKALADHVDEEDKLNNDSLLSLGKRGGWLINESGLYSLILSSKLPTAKQFKHWVTSEVLPTIRKHGAFMTEKIVEKVLNSPDFLIELGTKLKQEQEQRKQAEEKNRQLSIKNEQLSEVVKEQTEQIEDLTPKAKYHDKVINSKSLLPTTLIAKDFGMSAQELNEHLYDWNVQYKQGDVWILYAKYQNCGYAQTKTGTTPCKNGDCHTWHTLYWTEKGKKFIYKLLKEHGYSLMSEKEMPTVLEVPVSEFGEQLKLF